MPKRAVNKNCPYCGVPGKVSCMHNAKDLCMKCPTCRATWYSVSGRCPDCGKVSGYISNSPCVKCYGARHGKKLMGRVV